MNVRTVLSADSHMVLTSEGVLQHLPILKKAKQLLIEKT